MYHVLNKVNRIMMITELTKRNKVMVFIYLIQLQNIHAVASSN